VVYDGIAQATHYYADRAIAEYTLGTALEPGDYLVRFRAVWSPGGEPPADVDAELESKYGYNCFDGLEPYEGVLANGGQSLHIGEIAADVNIVPEVKLDSTGTRLEVTLTFYSDGQKDPVWAAIANNSQFCQDFLNICDLLLTVDNNGAETNWRSVECSLTENSVQAVFEFSSALPNGDYIFDSFNFSRKEGVTEEQIDALNAKYADDIATLEQALAKYGHDDFKGLVNGGQPVHVEKATTPVAPPSGDDDDKNKDGGGGGCDAGYGLLGLSLTAFAAARKSLKK
jgi:hypothetical protein